MRFVESKQECPKSARNLPQIWTMTVDNMNIHYSVNGNEHENVFNGESSQASLNTEKTETGVAFK